MTTQYPDTSETYPDPDLAPDPLHPLTPLLTRIQTSLTPLPTTARTLTTLWPLTPSPTPTHHAARRASEARHAFLSQLEAHLLQFQQSITTTTTTEGDEKADEQLRTLTTHLALFDAFVDNATCPLGDDAELAARVFRWGGYLVLAPRTVDAVLATWCYRHHLDASSLPLALSHTLAQTPTQPPLFDRLLSHPHAPPRNPATTAEAFESAAHRILEGGPAFQRAQLGRLRKWLGAEEAAAAWRRLRAVMWAYAEGVSGRPGPLYDAEVVLGVVARAAARVLAPEVLMGVGEVEDVVEEEEEERGEGQGGDGVRARL